MRALRPIGVRCLPIADLHVRMQGDDLRRPCRNTERRNAERGRHRRRHGTSKKARDGRQAGSAPSGDIDDGMGHGDIVTIRAADVPCDRGQICVKASHSSVPALPIDCQAVTAP